MTWTDDAACRAAVAQGLAAVDWWFPGVPRPRTADLATLICAACPVADACLEFVIDAMLGEPGSHGIYGGISARGRWRIRTGKATAAQERARAHRQARAAVTSHDTAPLAHLIHDETAA